MDPAKNLIPKNVKNIHLIAACGTAMGALAVMLKSMGYHVTGSDQNVYPPMSTFLRNHGVALWEGFDPEHLAGRPDLVIVGNAVVRANPEALMVHETGLNYCSMPQAVNHFITKRKKTIIVTGTHGKTTTSSILAWILYHAGWDPSFLIGGILNNFDSNHRLGKGDHVIIEGDEYDTAFFDKGPKFLHYQPEAAIITGIEFDHADIFNDLEHVMAAFSRFITNVPTNCRLYTFRENENLSQLLSTTSTDSHDYGTSADAVWHLANIYHFANETECEVYQNNHRLGVFRTEMVGRHNYLNALAAVAVANDLGVSFDTITRALKEFKGIKRRQEIRGIIKGIIVIDDFAHHPTAVIETTQAVKQRYPLGRLFAVFEPRTHTSMRKVFQERYAGAFTAADIVCIRSPSMLHKVPQEIQISSKKLVNDLVRQHKDAHHFTDTSQIINYIAKTAVSGDVILIMSNGGFDNIHQRLLEQLSSGKPS